MLQIFNISERHLRRSALTILINSSKSSTQWPPPHSNNRRGTTLLPSVSQPLSSEGLLSIVIFVSSIRTDGRNKIFTCVVVLLRWLLIARLGLRLVAWLGLIIRLRWRLVARLRLIAGLHRRLIGLCRQYYRLLRGCGRSMGFVSCSTHICVSSIRETAGETSRLHDHKMSHAHSPATPS
jgi:hypothetical protein